MSDFPTPTVSNRSQQQAVRDKCFHPTGTFIEFKKEEIEQSIPDRFEAQVRRNPDHLALKARDHAMTYDELNRAANRVAHGILAQRGTEEEPIALLFEQGPQAIVGILGVLKAGKIYVPLDPSYPRARNSYVVEDSQAGLILTNDRNLALARELAQHRCRLLSIEELDLDLAHQAPELFIAPDHLAYIVYTSGSTGQPKGVVENHRNVLHQVYRITRPLHICDEDRQTLLRSTSFSGSVRDIFGTLLNGAALYLLDIKEEGFSRLADWLIQEEITMYRSVVTVFRHFVNAITREQEFPKLRLIYVGGETLHKGDIDLYKAHFSPDCIFVDGLGITESGTVREHFIDKQTVISGNNVPAGYPIDDMEVLLLNDDGKEVGFGEIGEITVRSRYLSPGYWGRPDLTQAAFLPDPSGGEGRIYLTGDLGRMTPDGCLEHLGRNDFQVKVRGNRVEVGEVEEALLGLDVVNEVAVVSQEDLSGIQRLVAYVVPAGQPTPTIGELRDNLKEKLPDYMVPSAFVFLDALPTLPNGKLDRLALPAPSTARPELETPFALPATPVEESMVEIWTEVLGVDQVGINDNFLELGGDSLLAGQIISRVIRAFQVKLPLRTLFEAPTVADMAVAITQSQAKVADPEDIERLLAELEALSAGEAEQLLAEETNSSNRIGR